LTICDEVRRRHPEKLVVFITALLACMKKLDCEIVFEAVKSMLARSKKF
jgi:hypothetical protein